MTNGGGSAEDPWGTTEPPLTAGQPVPPLPRRLEVLAALDTQLALDPQTDPELVAAVGDGSVRAAELPEVAALAEQGWRPLEPAPVYLGVPAAWPAEHRGWVPDRLPHVSVTAADRDGRREVWPYDPHADAASWQAPAAAECGLPAPPEGRVWMLRSPWRDIAVEVLLTLANVYGVRAFPELAPQVALYRGLREVLSWDEVAVWAWWEDDTEGPDPLGAACARAWAARGRGGESSAALVLAHLSPEALDLLTAPLDQDGCELSEAQAVAWTQAAGTPAQVRVWRQLGLPPDPPLPSWRIRELDPGDVAAWFDASFTLEEVDQLRELGLDRAQAWRDAGFSAEDIVDLLGADPYLEPDEALAFTAAGVSAAARRAWIADGFDAAAARPYTDLDIYPGEARVWRATGRGPDDALAHRAAGGGPLPDDATDFGWFAYGTTGDRAHRRYQLNDPPGTRGRTAHEQRGR